MFSRFFFKDLSNLQSPKIIEYFQDQAQMTLSRYVNVHQPLQITRSEFSFDFNVWQSIRIFPFLCSDLENFSYCYRVYVVSLQCQ